MDGVILIVIYCNGEKYLIDKNQIYEPFPEKEGKEEEDENTTIQGNNKRPSPEVVQV